ncbi:hypothetical protein HGRIS_005213 [Hohenbuehelia grisea]|uniref:Uncharacterized protein n=1 Tax=Hohenbuehelia grisea TaxID=104357 RepID=A0ABR3JEA7_9AGAR
MSGLNHANIRKAVLETTDDKSVIALVDKIYKDAGCPLLDLSVDAAQAVMNVNFLATVRLVNAVLPRMAKRGSGMLVTLGSLCGELGTPFSGLYNASKAALHAYTETLTLECRPLGIDILLISGGSVISNIANNQAKIYKMPQNSLYKDFTKQIVRRLYASQGNNAMPTAIFAEKVVRTILLPRPPTYLCVGGNTGMYYLLKWLPRTVALWILWKVMARP